MSGENNDGSANDVHLGPFSYDVPDSAQEAFDQATGALRLMNPGGALLYDGIKAAADNWGGTNATFNKGGNSGGQDDTPASERLGNVLDPVKKLDDAVQNAKKLQEKVQDYRKKAKEAAKVGKGLEAAAKEVEDKAGDVAQGVSKATPKALGLATKIKTGYECASLAVKAVDAGIEFIFGFSPIDEWISKPFFGDWDELRETAAKWTALGNQLVDLSATLQALASAVDDSTWAGLDANMFKKRSESLAKAAECGVSPCEDSAQALETLADFAENAFDLVMDIIDEIVTIAGWIIPELAAPVVGWAAIAAEVTHAVVLAGEIVKAIMQVTEATATFNQTTMSVQEAIQTAETIASVFGTGA
ncbi:hypothetical protein [Bifidobacterium cuniculi]|uniref:Uncharacterized protein n=1 Tax=Bifidobacterium cuniculi TaxID=1688 RepID=A0A087AYP9_9BIFI|nr:hypothetical protein [Bifidobacterium cuniculi]KFI63899.1 hypothetical protein BCUN_1511 [Bifidobacterium cuniculi]